MGCCFSDDSSEQQTDPDETTRLLADVAGQEAQYPRIENAPSPDANQKTDELSALNRILLNTANNVIDVAQLDSQQMEQQEYMERARQYSTRLAVKCSGSHTLHHVCSQSLPPGVAAPYTVLAASPLSPSDIILIKNSTNQVSKLIKDISVKHKEDLVVPFGVP